MFTDTCTAWPHSTAVFYRGEEFSRHWLHSTALRLQHLLSSAGVRSREVVALCLSRSPQLLAAVMACIASDAVFLLMDPILPLPQLQTMLSLSRPALLLYDSSSASGSVPSIQGIKQVDISQDYTSLNPPSHHHPSSCVLQFKEEDVLYLIFTSGSTGLPKGIMASAAGTLNRLQWMWSSYPFATGELICFKTSVQFVDCLWEILGGILQGAPVVIASNEDVADPTLLLDLIHTHQVTRLSLVPTYISVLLTCSPTAQQKLSSLRVCVSSGEPLPLPSAELLLSVLPHCTVLNLYGSSEVAADVCFYELNSAKLQQLIQQDSPLSSIPIGEPIANTDVHIIPSSSGGRGGGELVVTGVAVAHGYLQLESNNKFGFQSGDGSSRRSFQTGDMVFRLSTGELVCAGRGDSQLKVRGIRVEAGEVVGWLLRHSSVQQAVVTVCSDRQQLIAYVQTSATPPPGIHAHEGHQYYLNYSLAEDILALMKGSSPDHLVPSLLIFTPQLPLLPSGKVNRRLLPPVSVLHQATPTPEGDDNSSITSKLSHMFSTLLGVADVRPSSNFFHLGGHSLLAIRLVHQIAEELNCTIPLSAVFTHQTLSSLADFIEHEVSSSSSASSSSSPSPSFSQWEGQVVGPVSHQQLGVWIGQQLLPHSSAYNLELAYVARETLSPALLRRSIEYLVARHETLRTVFVPGDGGHPQQHILPWKLEEPLPLVQSALVVADQSTLQWINGKPNLPSVIFNLTTGPLFRFLLFIGASSSSSPSSSPSLSFPSSSSSLSSLSSSLSSSSSSSLSLPSSSSSSILAIQIHHIITDGWSLKLLLEELEQIYTGLVTGCLPCLPPPCSFLNYAISQHNCFANCDLSDKFHYWRRQLSDLTPRSSLPPDKLRPPVPSAKAQTMRSLFRVSLTTLSKFCTRHHVTEFMVLLASLQLTLYLLGRSEDITVGTAVVNRNTHEEAEMLGLFVNMLAIHSVFSRATSFLSLLHQVKKRMLEAFDHALPLEFLEKGLEPSHELYMQPLYQVMVVFQREDEQPLTNSFLFDPLPLHITSCECDMDVYVCLSRQELDRLTVDIRYSTDLYTCNTIKRFVEQWESMLQAVLVTPHIYLRCLLQPPSPPPPSHPSTTPSLLYLSTSPSPALQVGSEALSWNKLRTVASRAQQDLVEQQAGIAASLLPLSPLAVALSLGSISAGVPSVLLTPAQVNLLPPSAVLLTEEEEELQHSSQHVLPEPSPPHPPVQGSNRPVECPPSLPPDITCTLPSDVTAFSTILSLYINGSSPKSAVLLGAGSSLLALTHSLLLSGLSVTLYDHTVLDSGQLFTHLAEDKVKLLACPAEALPSITSQLSYSSCPPLEYLWVHGLPSALSHLSQWSSLLLPTTRVLISHSLIPSLLPVTHHFDLSTVRGRLADSSSLLPIGYVSPLLHWRLVHTDGRTMPVGSVGAFVTTSSDGSELHSQCLLRLLEEGGLFELVAADITDYYSGDDTTPLLTALSKHPGITWSSVHGQLLHYSTTTDTSLSPDQLKTYLKTFVMVHCIPSSIHQLPHVRLTSSFAVSISPDHQPSTQPQREGGEDGCQLREKVMAAVCDLLGLETVQQWRSFHSLGGHSLLTMRLASMLSQELGVTVDIRTVFEAPSLTQLVKELHVLQTKTREGQEPVFCSCHLD